MRCLFITPAPLLPHSPAPPLPLPLSHSQHPLSFFLDNSQLEPVEYLRKIKKRGASRRAYLKGSTQMNVITRYFLLFLTLSLTVIGLATPQSVAAQQTPADAAIARSVVRGYLTGLMTGYLNEATLARLYLADETVGSGIGDLEIDAYAITMETWLDADDYRATALIEPGNQSLLVSVSRQENGRWLISDLMLVDTAALALTSANPGASAADTLANAPTAEVQAYELNLRAGPGVQYAVLDTLKQGDTADIIGVNATGEWYQVAQTGQTIGWMSASPAYIKTDASAADLPVAFAPALSDANSASGGQLLLQPQSGGAFYLVNNDASGLRQISSGIDPALSPDGTKIAFTRWGPGNDGSVWIYDLTTGAEWQVLGETQQVKSPTWSADGSQLVVSYQNGGRPEIEAHCDERGKRPPPGAYDINIGSTSGRICYKLPADPHWQLRQIDVNSGEFEDLPSQTYSTSPTWDPANDWRVVFAGSTGLQQLDLNQSEYFPFTDDLRDHAPVFSPDGSQVALSYQQDNHWEIYTISASDGSRARLTESPLFADTAINSAAPAWSPDGSQIAYVTDQNGQWEFWLMNSDGSNPHPLLPDDVAAQLDVQYSGVDGRLISWGK